MFFQCNTPSKSIVKKKLSLLREIKTIRVLLDGNLPNKELQFNSDILLKYNEKEIALIRKGETFHISRSKSALEVRTKRNKFSLEYVDICPSKDNDLLEYKTKTYRGIFRIKQSGQYFILINLLNVEDYLKAVIFAEMGPANRPEDFEALKAYSVCLRNYTYMKIKESKGEFDVYPDSRDQVYKGVLGERSFTTKAIEETNSLILEYNGQLAKTFYYSSCGGYTENSDNVFSEKGIAYLSGIKDGDDPYCKISPGFSWVESYSSTELLSLLKKAKYLESTDSKIKDIEIKSRFNSDRVNELKITIESNSDKVRDLFLVGNSIRSVILSKTTKGILRSTMFDIEKEYKNGYLHSLKIVGKGNGHGVGFCQWGAIAQSRSGKRFDELLYFYFPGTKLSEI